MSRKPRPKDRDTPPPDALTILLCSAEPSLKAAWVRASPPAGFRLESAESLSAEPLARSDAILVLVDAEAARASEGDLAEALEAAAPRCVWVGPAQAVELLGAARIEQAYDILVTPTSPEALGRRLRGWARNIQQTAALEEMGRRAEQLAEQNDRLAARVAEMEAQARMAEKQRGRLDQALARIRQVAQLSREVNALDLDRIVKVCIERLPALVGAKRASMYLYDAADNRLILQGHSHGYPIAERVDLDENARSPMAAALRSGELLLISEFQAFEQARDMVLEREFREQYATGSCVIVPLKAGGTVRGVLNLADKESGAPFDPEIDLPVIEQIAELIGASIYNVELYQEMERRAKTDPLTDLANRRATDEALARETDRGRRYSRQMSVLMIDVDGLKAVNDAHGHEAGDRVLKDLAAMILETVRSVDAPGRWAGDEFLVVLPDTSASQANLLATRLVERARAQPTRIGEKPVELSLSIGVAEYDGKETTADLVRRVDRAMYDAKRQGRGRIATAEA
ncbi:MAG: diguanylate cyclase [Phycisphaerae bacterium]